MHWLERASWLVTAMLLFLTTSVHGADAQNLDARRQQLKQGIVDEWEYELKQSPELATAVGDYRYNDHWGDASLAHLGQLKQDSQNWIARFEAIDDTAFPEQEKLNRALMLRNLNQRVEAIDLGVYEMPVDQFNGVHLQLAQFVAAIPFDSTKHYEDYLNRLHLVPQLFEQVTEVLKRGENDGLMPPQFLLEKTVDQCKDIAAPAGEASAFGQPVARFPDSVPVADRKRLHDAILNAVDHEVRPAYTRLADFLAAAYAPKGRKDPGVWALPGGDALYRFDIRQLTTTNLEPAAIHELGLQEVARIEGEQLSIAKKLGFADLKNFRAALKANPNVIPTSGEQILEKYRAYIAGMEPQLPKLFGILPKTRVEVRPVEKFREKEAAGASYFQGTPDGARPGIIYVNTGDYAHRSLLSVESTAYHEGIPGHHMQIAIAQTLPELPAFRQQGGNSGYVEGWALYSESLGKELGFYQDPYSDYGRLSDEMLRAVRLVVDTGVHYGHWTRQQIVDFFHEHTNQDEPDLQAETDRYIAWPGQALSYKLGQLEILKLRERAKTELGSKFDIRAFHDEILNGGALPLDMLDERVSAWITVQKNHP